MKKLQSECDKIRKVRGKVFNCFDNETINETWTDQVSLATAKIAKSEEEWKSGGDLFANRRVVNYTTRCVNFWDFIDALRCLQMWRLFSEGK